MEGNPDLKRLIQYLKSIQAGPVSDSTDLAKLLIESWDEFEGSDAEGMRAYKLGDGRTQNVSWNPPLLKFSIERHGGTVQGSSRAERHEWTIDIEARTAVPEKLGFE